MIADTPVIELKDVVLFRGEKTILDGVNWRVRRGEHWAIVGANGSGKTTLLRIAAGTLWPSRGTVSVLGQRFGEVDLRELRKRIGWVSSALQDRMPPSLPAMKAVVSGASATIGLFDEPAGTQWDRANQLAEQLGIAQLGDRPFGVLSLGEQQRVLIARALMPDPPLLILDEPCAGLDLAAREQLLETVESLGRGDSGRTLVLVSHHIEEITPAFSRVLLLSEGRAAAQGPKPQVLTGPQLSNAFGLDVVVETAADRYWARLRKSPSR
ncbi:MAG: ABC transporter ATP-binding protein [Phycisphaerae bacterium]